MRISYSGAFSEVNRLINSTPALSKAKETKDEFNQILDRETQLPENIKTNDQAPQFNFEPKKLSFEIDRKIGMRFPSLEPIESPKTVPEPAMLDSQSEDTASVKTPSVVRVKRVPHALLNNYLSKSSFEPVSTSIHRQGEKNNVDPHLALAVVSVESSFNPKAVSKDGYQSKGLFQLLDSTGRDLMERASLSPSKAYNPFDPELNVELGVGYLRYLHDIFGATTRISDSLTTSAAANSSSLEKLAIAAFNAGEGRVATAQQRVTEYGGDAGNYDQVSAYLPKTTQDYVKKVLVNRDEFKRYFLG